MLYLRTIVQPLSERHARRNGIGEIVEAAAREPSDLTTRQP
jgi:hypothetical protein